MALCFVPQGRVAMSSTTDKAIKPAKPSLADYEAWKEEQIRLGLEDFEQGRIVDHETVMARLRAKIQRYRKKNAKAA